MIDVNTAVEILTKLFTNDPAFNLITHEHNKQTRAHEFNIIRNNVDNDALLNVNFFIEYTHPDSNEPNALIGYIKLTTNLSLRSDVNKYIPEGQEAAMVTMFNAALGGYGSISLVGEHALYRIIVPISLPTAEESIVTIIKHITSVESLTNVFGAIANAVDVVNVVNAGQHNSEQQDDEGESNDS